MNYMVFSDTKPPIGSFSALFETGTFSFFSPLVATNVNDSVMMADRISSSVTLLFMILVLVEN